jgi:hypothetical protein
MHPRIQVLALIALFGLSDSVDAQMFGPRRIGRNSARRTVVDASDVGTATADRRFIRGSRSIEDFVGADSQETSAFVGSAQTINDGEVTTAVEGLREQPTARVNRAATPFYRGRYEPRLQVDFALQAPLSDDRSGNRRAPGTPLSAQLQTLSAASGFQVSLAPRARVATLTGTVQTERDRRIAELLVMFEPGVESVKNDLRVTGQPPPAPNAKSQPDHVRPNLR